MTSDVPSTADIQLIQQCIPHRYPFLLVDRVEDIRAKEFAKGIKMVTMNEPHFQGHFPGLPIMPGVTIIEAMAQTSAVMVSLSLGLVGSGAVGYFMGIDSAQFRRKVVPGDVLELHVTTIRGGAKVWKFDGRAMVGDELACEATFMAMIDVTGGKG